MNWNNKALRAGIMLAGAFVFGLGIGMTNLANLGMDPLSVFSDGVHLKTGLSLGVANGLLSLAQIALALFLDRKRVTWLTILAIPMTTFGIDLVSGLSFPAASVIIRVILMLAGILVYSFGISMTHVVQMGYNSYDAYIFSLSRIFHTESYHKLRWGTDAVFLLLGWLLGGTIGICTVLVLAVTGKLTELWNRLLKAWAGK